MLVGGAELQFRSGSVLGMAIRARAGANAGLCGRSATLPNKA